MPYALLNTFRRNPEGVFFDWRIDKIEMEHRGSADANRWTYPKILLPFAIKDPGMKNGCHEFSAKIKIIGINPYVSVPKKILMSIFKDADKDKGPIPIRGSVNEKPYLQTLMKYAGEWRLYINTTMLARSPERIGEKVVITVSFDPKERKIDMHPLLKKALDKNKIAKTVFTKLSPSRQKEIVRYISYLKTEEKIKENVSRAINFLLGKEKFAGRVMR